MKAMAEETTHEFLARRRHVLKSRIAALHGQIAPLELELAQVQQMLDLLPMPDARPLQELARIVATQAIVGQIEQASPNLSIQELVHASYATRTIKDLIIQALIDGFLHGATTTQLRSFIQSGYGRAIDPGSLRTQLHRLKVSGILGQDPNSDIWNFRDGQRPLFAMYDHPTSRRDMKDLQDDEPYPWENDPSSKGVDDKK